MKILFSCLVRAVYLKQQTETAVVSCGQSWTETLLP